MRPKTTQGSNLAGGGIVATSLVSKGLRWDRSQLKRSKLWENRQIWHYDISTVLSLNSTVLVLNSTHLSIVVIIEGVNFLFKLLERNWILSKNRNYSWGKDWGFSRSINHHPRKLLPLKRYDNSETCHTEILFLIISYMKQSWKYWY